MAAWSGGAPSLAGNDSTQARALPSGARASPLNVRTWDSASSSRPIGVLAAGGPLAGAVAAGSTSRAQSTATGARLGCMSHLLSAAAGVGRLPGSGRGTIDYADSPGPARGPSPG